MIAKRALFESYEAAFSSVEGVNLMVEPKKCRSNYWLQTLIIDNDQLDQRDLYCKILIKEVLPRAQFGDLCITYFPFLSALVWTCLVLRSYPKS